jgi:hypothetical protein
MLVHHIWKAARFILVGYKRYCISNWGCFNADGILCVENDKEMFQYNLSTYANSELFLK